MDAMQKPEKEAQNMEEILALAQKTYPGREWDGLSKDEQDAVFNAYEGQRDLGYGLAQAGQKMTAGAGKTVGPLGVYINNPWESLGGGLMAGVGYGMQAKANRLEKAGRKATADMATNRDARDRESENARAAEEERKRREWLSQMFGGQR